MNGKKAFAAVWALIAFAAVSEGKTDGDGYRIPFRRPFAAGEVFLLDVVSNEKNAVVSSRGGEVLDSRVSQWRVTLEARCSVAEASEGNLVKAVFTVHRFTSDQGDGPREILAPKTVVTASYGEGPPTFTVNGKPIDEAVRIALLHVVPGDASRSGNDAVFGTDVPRKPGDCWEVDAGRVAAEFRNRGLTVHKESLKGAMCLEKTLTVDRLPCVQLRGWLELTGMGYPGLDLTVGSSKMRVDYAGIFPVDERKQCLDSAIVMHLTLAGTMKPPDGEGDITVDLTMSQEVRARISYR